MHAPQIIYIIIMTIALTAHINNHGKPTNEKYNWWAKLISTGITVGLLIWGGFFK